MAGDVRIASWNVLADAYIRPDLYAHCDPRALEPHARRAAVIDVVARFIDGDFGADVVALQEVDAALVAALRARFGDPRVHFAPKGLAKPDGCAFVLGPGVDVNAARFQPLAYDDGTGHIAALLALGDVPRLSSRRVVVATTHFKWDPPGMRRELRVGLAQARTLAMHLERVAAGAVCVVCGDFNAEHDDDILTRFAGLADAYEERGGATCVANGRARRIDFLLVSRGVVARPEPVVLLHAHDACPSLTLPSDHAPIAVTVTLP